jgi:hypothetical protein
MGSSSEIKPNPFLFPPKEKATEVGRTTWMNVVEKKETQETKTKSKGAKKGDIPIFKRTGKEKKNDKTKVGRRSHKLE